MNRLLITAMLIAGVAMSGCTKQETKENLRNIKGGLKNTWHNVKEGVSDTTQKFNEETR
jgi:hypothetical protein